MVKASHALSKAAERARALVDQEENEESDTEAELAAAASIAAKYPTATLNGAPVEKQHVYNKVNACVLRRNITKRPTSNTDVVQQGRIVAIGDRHPAGRAVDRDPGGHLCRCPHSDRHQR